MQASNIIDNLFRFGHISTDSTTLRSGEQSNVYINLRSALCDPRVQNQVVTSVVAKCGVLRNSVLCGVPLGGAVLAIGMSLSLQTQLILLRKENDVKAYGANSGNRIEGGPPECWCNDCCMDIILIEDVITTGASAYKAVDYLRSQGHTVSKILCFVDRNDATRVTPDGYPPIQSAYTFNEVGRAMHRWECQNRWSGIVQSKNSRVCLSADVDTLAEVEALLDQTSDRVVVVKLHIDTMQYVENLSQRLLALKEKYNVMLWEDAKLADISSTNIRKLNGHTRINEWADFVSIHTYLGPTTVKETYNSVAPQLIGIAGMTNADSRVKTSSSAISKMPLIGVVRPGRGEGYEGVINFIPGICFDVISRGDQQYTSPHDMRHISGDNCFVIGRGIYTHDHPKLAVANYANALG